MRDDFVLVVIVAAVGLSSCLSCTAIPAEAQSREPAAVTLTRALVAEADGHEADYAPILACIQHHADRVGARPETVVRSYSRLYRARVVTPRLRAILAMPAAMSWARRGQWERASAVVADWLAGNHEHGCSAQPHHFGDRHGDAARALGAGWVEVSCPGTRNGFWRVRP